MHLVNFSPFAVDLPDHDVEQVGGHGLDPADFDSITQWVLDKAGPAEGVLVSSSDASTALAAGLQGFRVGIVCKRSNGVVVVALEDNDEPEGEPAPEE